MYLQLHKLDGNDSPPPFRVSLTTKTRFSIRLASITQAISEGKGFSQLSFLQYYEYDEPTELPDEDFDDDFDEAAEPDEPQQPTEDDVPSNESAQNVAEEEHPTLSPSASQVEQQHEKQDGPAQESEYEGEISAHHDVLNDTADHSEYNQDDTQYFDAQGGESELLVENHGDGEDNASAEAHQTTNNVETVVDDDPGHEGQNADGTVHDENASEHDEQEEHFEQHAEEQQEFEAQEEEHVFGQGEFFDENYEYQDGEVHDQEDGYAPEEEAIDKDSHSHHEEQEVEAPAAEEHNDNIVTPPGEIAHADELQTGHDDGQDAHQQDSTADKSVDNGVADAEHGSAVIDDATSKDSVKGQSLAVEDDDYDEINFDDEDSYDDDGAGLAPVLTNTSSKASPGTKRSFSELDQVDDEQDSKKARAS